MNHLLRGFVRGKTIELDEDPGFADGQPVHVQIQPATASKRWGDGLRRCAGSMADDPEFDTIAAEIQEERKRATFRDASE
jgi:hypothetical protein